MQFLLEKRLNGCQIFWSSVFIYRSTLMHDIGTTLSVCLSVCDIPVLDENGLTYCRSFSTIR